MKKKRIYIKDWLELKPYEKQTTTDAYYLKLCNEVKDKLINNHYVILNYYFDEEFINLLSCFLVSYFEDIISETNIWTSFVELHKELYNKPLPFYETNEYYEGEINEPDLIFLIWYFFNTLHEDQYIKPENRFFYEMAADIFEIFDEEYEYAPENEVLKKYYEIDEQETNFYTARNLIDAILFRTYLFYPDTLLDLEDAENEIIEEIDDKENIIHYFNENRDTQLHKVHTKLLSLKGKEWAAKIIGKEHPLYKDFLNISNKIHGFFLYKGQDKDNIFIEHIASGKKFNLTKKSFDYSDELTEIDTILFMGIVKWREEWWFSGIYFQKSFDADLVLNERNSVESRMAVSFLDFENENVDEVLKLQFNAFKEFNNGSQIAFMPTNEIDEFVNKYTEYYNESLNLTEKEKKAAIKRARKDGFFGSDDEATIDYSDSSETALVFFNPKRGVEAAIEVNSAFPLPENKYFNEEESTNHVMGLFTAKDISPELVFYCIDNCKENIPFFKEKEGKQLLKDIDFLLRFWKKDNYHTVPALTFAGSKDK